MTLPAASTGYSVNGRVATIFWGRNSERIVRAAVRIMLVERGVAFHDKRRNANESSV